MANHPPIYNLVALAWADTRANFNIPRRYAEQLLDGVTSDLVHDRYETFGELAQYCYGVASTVGLMAMHIVGFESNKAIPYAIKLGVALQLTNILRDVQEDWENGRLYLPREELRMFNLSEADIAAGTIDHRWRAFMRFQIRRRGSCMPRRCRAWRCWVKAAVLLLPPLPNCTAPSRTTSKRMILTFSAAGPTPPSKKSSTSCRVSGGGPQPISTNIW